MGSPALDNFRAWQDRIRLTSDHMYLVQQVPGGEWVHVPGCTDVIPKDKGAINALMTWAAKQVVSAATTLIAEGGLPGDLMTRETAANLIEGCSNAHNERRDKAADSGTSMHALFEHEVRLMMGQSPARPERTDAQQLVVDKFLRWAERTNLQPFATEARVYHPENVHAGTLDLGARLRGERSKILDYKPLKPGARPRVWDNYVLQSASYRVSQAVMCGFNEPLGGEIIFYPTPENVDGDVVSLPINDDVHAAYDAFVGCLAFYRWTKRNARRRKAA